MARNRLAQAKGAALLLLARAYLHRDRVALIAFRGPGATLLLPPTRSTAQARRLLEQLPAGGGTPLASALALSLQVAQRAAAQRLSRCALVLLTDGRANVPLAGLGAAGPPDGVAAEVAALAERWAALTGNGTATALVIDTRLRYVGGGDAVALATALGGQYLYLPQAAPDAVRRAAEESVLAHGWR
jgi:magnesium chelatase subunit D